MRSGAFLVRRLLGRVIHRFIHIGDSYTRVRHPVMNDKDPGKTAITPAAGPTSRRTSPAELVRLWAVRQRQRVVIRKPMNMMPKPTRMFQVPSDGTG